MKRHKLTIITYGVSCRVINYPTNPRYSVSDKRVAFVALVSSYMIVNTAIHHLLVCASLWTLWNWHHYWLVAYSNVIIIIVIDIAMACYGASHCRSLQRHLGRNWGSQEDWEWGDGSSIRVCQFSMKSFKSSSVEWSLSDFFHTIASYSHNLRITARSLPTVRQTFVKCVYSAKISL